VVPVTTLAVRPPDVHPWTAELQELDRRACQVLHEHQSDRPHGGFCVKCRRPWPCPPVNRATNTLTLIS
jgi:hypothetical protein